MELNTANQRCPEYNTLTALIERRLPTDALEHLGHHIDECDHCRQLLVVMACTSVAAPRRSSRMQFRIGDGSEGTAAADTAHAGVHAASGTPNGQFEPTPGAPGASGQPAEERGFFAPGSSVGRFVVRKMLGAGGMGVVYEAHDPQLDRCLALKLIRPEFVAGGAAMKARLIRESQAQARLSHPNVVAVYDCGSFDDQLFVAMEYVDGITLSQWLADDTRTLTEIIDVFLQAGRGLQAAHEAGVVHRDFKPDNVLIGRDRRVCVADFGLARTIGAAMEEPEPSAVDRPGRSSEAPVTSTITRTGAIVGTPAYMAPEQHEQRPTDARTDEFSFCVALYEAVYGERPFPGRTVAEIAAAVSRGEVRKPSKNMRVPPRLRRVLLRGLRIAPEDRYPSMRAVLRALERSRRSLLGPVALGAGLVVLAGFGLSAAMQDAASQPVCTTAVQRLDDVWDAKRKAEVHAALTSEGSSQSEKRWSFVEQRLDTHASAWLGMRAEVCLATQSKEQSPELLDLRMNCLDTELDRLGRITSLLATADPELAANALDAVRGLPALELCSATVVLAARVPQPTDERTRTEVAAIRSELVRAQVQYDAGRVREALALLEPLEQRTQSLGYRPIEAEVLYLLGYVRAQIETPQAGEATLRQAAHAAEAGRHDEMAAEVWTALVLVAAQDLGDFPKAYDYADRATAAIERLGGNKEIEARLDLNLGQAYSLESRLDLAHESFSRAAQYGSEEEKLEAMARSGDVYVDEGKFEEALQTQEYVLGERRKHLGPDHPEVGAGHSRIAGVLFQMGRFDEAGDHARKALAISEATLGPDQLETAQDQHNLAAMLSAGGQNEEALRLHTKSLVTFERLMGPEHTTVANSLVSQSEILVRVDRADDAVAISRRALSIYQAQPEARGFDLARCLINFGDALREAKQYPEALVIARRGLEELELALGGETPFSGYGWTGIGRTLLDSGNASGAIEALDRALEMYATGEVDPGQIGVAKFALAQALWNSKRDRSRARTLAQQARDIFVAGGPARERELHQLDRWLATLR